MFFRSRAKPKNGTAKGTKCSLDHVVNLRREQSVFHKEQLVTNFGWAKGWDHPGFTADWGGKISKVENNEGAGPPQFKISIIATWFRGLFRTLHTNHVSTPAQHAGEINAGMVYLTSPYRFHFILHTKQSRFSRKLSVFYFQIPCIQCTMFTVLCTLYTVRPCTYVINVKPGNTISW